MSIEVTIYKGEFRRDVELSAQDIIAAEQNRRDYTCMCLLLRYYFLRMKNKVKRRKSWKKNKKCYREGKGNYGVGNGY